MNLPYNPFDFANPVSDKDLFVGRDAELEEVRYYLDEMKAAPRPINLALLGPRAAGKTSFLNMIAIDARTRGCCPVRIDLNEGDTQDETAFFFKLFDAVLGAACSDGAYGGTSGKTYDTYLDMAYAYTVPEDRTFCPFLFPLQYAKARQAGVDRTFVSDHALKRDLAAIRKELRSPVVLLFDECNVLAKSRIILEKIRNLFMNTAGFMLVFTGTPDLFPVMDEIFSPIIRQFKKIPIGAFKTVGETLKCIRRPLEMLETINPDDLMYLTDTSTSVREIHELSGGRPYEVKLICHMLFKRIQQKKAEQMIMDFSVLEDVRRELEAFQDISKRPIVAQVQRLTKRQLSGLALLCSLEGRLTAEDVWAAHHVLAGEKSWTREALQMECERLVQNGLIEVESDKTLRFKGDDFDRIYTKYLAKERDVRAFFWLTSMDEFINAHLGWKLARAKGVKHLMYEMPAPEGLDIVGAARLLLDDGDVEPFADGREIVTITYKLLMSFAGQEKLPMIKADICISNTTVQYWFYPSDPSQIDGLQTVLSTLEDLAARSSEVSCKVSFDQIALCVPPTDQLVLKVKRTGNASVRHNLGGWHLNELGNRYIVDDIDGAKLHSGLAVLYLGEDQIRCSANVGYFLLAQGQVEAAEQLLNRPDDPDEPFVSSLCRYNLAVLRIKQARFEEAETILKSVVATLGSCDDMDGCLCLLVPKCKDGQLLVAEERGDVRLRQVAAKALDVVTAYLLRLGQQ
jgi:hypothetical protein